MNTINVTTAKTAELVAFYNEHTGKSIKKFQNRATAERRVQDLIDSLEEAMTEQDQQALDIREEQEDQELKAATGRTHCPACDVHLSNGYDINEKTGGAICMGCGHEWGGKGASEFSEKRSRGIKESWQNKEVAAARTRRHAVIVSGGSLDGPTEFKSVPAAFKALGLPMNKMPIFRKNLKFEGVAEDFGYSWKAVQTH